MQSGPSDNIVYFTIGLASAFMIYSILSHVSSRNQRVSDKSSLLGMKTRSGKTYKKVEDSELNNFGKYLLEYSSFTFPPSDQLECPSRIDKVREHQFAGEVRTLAPGSIVRQLPKFSDRDLFVAPFAFC
jgi:hypothetical protein